MILNDVETSRHELLRADDGACVIMRPHMCERINEGGRWQLPSVACQAGVAGSSQRR